MRGKVLSLLAAVLIVTACAQSDAEITAKIKTKLTTDRSISSASHIDVATQKRTVTLTGTAETPEAKERAVVLARGTEDVKDVRDQLSVVPAQAEVAANGSASAAPAVGAPSDAAITSTIETKLQSDQRVAGARIGVATNLGVVTLSGTVQSDQVKRDAMQIAQDTAGVQRVEDKLTVKSS